MLSGCIEGIHFRLHASKLKQRPSWRIFPDIITEDNTGARVHLRAALNRTYESYPGAKPAVFQVKAKL